MLAPRKLHSYMTSNFVLARSSSNWWAYDCPFCTSTKGKKKMAIHFGYQYVKCWVCDYASRATQFIMDYENEDYRTIVNRINKQVSSAISMENLVDVGLSRGPVIKTAKIPFGFQSLIEGNGSLSNRARAYLINRGFDIDELDMKGFGYIKEHAPDTQQDCFGRIIVPFKRGGKFVYYVARDFLERDEKWKYMNPPVGDIGVGKADLWYNEDAISMYDTVYITEGWACAETMGDNAVSSQGWSLSKIQKGTLYNGNAKNLIFLPDKGFYGKALKTASEFLDVKNSVKVVNLDSWEGEGNDPNKIGRDNITELVRETRPLTFADVIQNEVAQ